MLIEHMAIVVVSGCIGFWPILQGSTGFYKVRL